MGDLSKDSGMELIDPRFDLCRHIVELAEQGYTIIPGILSGGQIETAKIALDRILAEEVAIGSDPETDTESHQVTFLLPGKDPLFRAMPANPCLMAIMENVLGPDFVLAAFNGLIMKPQGKAQRLHMDQEDSVSDMAVTINALHVLDDFTKENGATRLVPGSHKSVWPRRGAMDERESDAIHICAPAGSVIAYNGGILHAGSANLTNQPRRALHLFYCRKWVLPHWDFEKSLPSSICSSMSDEEKRLFGFRHRPDWYDFSQRRKQRGRALPEVRPSKRGLFSWGRK